MVTVHIDFESYSIIDLKKTGVDVYAAHETTGAWCMSWAIDDGPVELWRQGDPPPTALFDAIENGCTTIVAHNVSFELAIWNGPMRRRFDWPELPVSQCECTQSMAYAMALPGSLEKAAAATGIKFQKDMAGSRVMMQLCQPRSYRDDGTPVWWDDEEKFERLYAYCKQDLEVERELHKRLLRLSESEREIFQLDYQINRRGVCCDVQAVKAAIAIVEFEQARLNREMQKVTENGVATCTATAQLTDWIKFQGVELDGVAKADVTSLLARSDLPHRVRLALSLRQEAAKSSTAKLKAMLDRAGSGGRIRGIFQYHGAGTGRWAGRGIQPQNFPRPKISQDEIETVFELLERVQ